MHRMRKGCKRELAMRTGFCHWSSELNGPPLRDSPHDLSSDRSWGVSRRKGGSVFIKVIVNDKGNPPGKLADVELHFTEGPRSRPQIGMGSLAGRPRAADSET